MDSKLVPRVWLSDEEIMEKLMQTNEHLRAVAEHDALRERWIFVVHVTLDEREVEKRDADKQREAIRLRLCDSIENFNVVQDIDVVARVVRGEDVVDYICPKEPSSAPSSKRTGFLADDEPAFVEMGEELAKHDKIFADWWDHRPATYLKERG